MNILTSIQNMMWIQNSLIVLGAFILMEGVALISHKYIMHGFLWKIHKDHHAPHTKSIEHNDSFFLIFATPAIICFLIGFDDFSFCFWLGLGITCYGIAYFFIHDIFIHQRINFLKHTRLPYLRAIRKAHKVHHKHLDKENGECFGMLWAPLKYFREEGKNVN